MNFENFINRNLTAKRTFKYRLFDKNENHFFEGTFLQLYPYYFRFEVMCFEIKFEERIIEVMLDCEV